MAEKVTVSTTISPDLWAYCERVAKQLGTTRNELITEALGRLLPEKEFEIHQEDYISDLTLTDAEDF